MSTRQKSEMRNENIAAEASKEPAATPRSLLFAFLAWLWIFPTLGAVWILITGRALRQPEVSLSQGLQAIRLEEWLAIALLLTHVLFAGLAIHFRRTEMRARSHSKEPSV